MKSALPPELWQARYEALRQHVLNRGHTLATPAAAHWQEQLTFVLAQITRQQIHPGRTP